MDFFSGRLPFFYTKWDLFSATKHLFLAASLLLTSKNSRKRKKKKLASSNHKYEHLLVGNTTAAHIVGAEFQFQHTVPKKQGRFSYPVKHSPGGVSDGLHAEPGVLESVAQLFLQPPDVAHQPRRRLRRHVNLKNH